MTAVLHDTAEAARLLRRGALVAFGTETVYGLGGDATDETVLAAIFACKGRPSFNPLICHFADAGAAFAEVLETEAARKLADRFWPGPLTLVLRRRPECRIGLLASAGLDTVAVRVPASPPALSMLRQAGMAVAAPSANRSGRISPTTADHVLADLGGSIAAVLDTGPCPVGIESTVLDLSNGPPVLLRPGGIPLAAIENRLAQPLTRHPNLASAPLRGPGMLASHYAPHAPLRLNAVSVSPDEALLAFGPPLPGAAACWNLSARADPDEAAARLFAGLHWLDAAAARLNLRGIAAMAVPASGLGEAVNDRLARAAAPRPAI